MSNSIIGCTWFLSTVILAAVGQLKWTVIHDGKSAAPSPRRDAGIGYNKVNNSVLLFGGKDAMNEYLNDTWIYSIDKGTWQEIIPYSRPPGRSSFVYGSAHDMFYIATGEKPLLNDIWEFDFRKHTWKRLPQKTCDEKSLKLPKPRYGAAGGIHPQSNQFYVSLGFGEKRYFDTFAYDINMKCWEAVTSSDSSVYNPYYPHGRCLHGGAMTNPDELVIFGGCLGGGGAGGPCPAGDTWLLSKGKDNNMGWESMPFCPIPRIYTTMAKLPSPSRGAVLYGGMVNTKQVLMTQNIPANEVAIFDPVSKSWSLKETQEETSPARRSSVAMVTAADGIYMFGGVSRENGKLLNDLWLLSGDVDKSPNTEACNRSFFNFIMVHGILMFLGWGLFLQVGAFIARYLKGIGKTWFHLHIGFQIFGLLLSLAGFVFAILSVESSKSHFSLAHGILGLIVMVGGCLQPLNAVFRPHVGKVKTTGRKVWEVLHHSLGRIVLILAMVNITLGLFVGLVARPVWIAFLVYWGVFVLAYIISEARKTKMKNK